MEDGCKLELIKWVTTSSNFEAAWVEGQLSELGACERGRAAGNAGSERLWRTDATDPCTLASAPAVASSDAARAPSWDSWKGGGAAEGAVIPAATTPCVERVRSTWWVTA